MARRWDATTTRPAVLNRSITALDAAAATKVAVVAEAQEGAMVDETATLHPETVVAIQPRLRIGCHLLLEQWALVAVCRHHHHPLISATVVDTVDTGADTTRAMAMEADMVHHQGSTMEVAEVEEVIKDIKDRGISNHHTLVVMTVDREVMEGTEATIAVTMATVVATVARSRYMFTAPVGALSRCELTKAPNRNSYQAHNAV